MCVRSTCANGSQHNRCNFAQKFFELLSGNPARNQPLKGIFVASIGKHVIDVQLKWGAFDRMRACVPFCFWRILRLTFHPVVPLNRPRCQSALSPFTQRVYFDLDSPVNLLYKRAVEQELYTTGEAAKKAGISRQTLQAWISAKKVHAPRVVGGVRVWTKEQIAKLKETKLRVHRDFRGKKQG